MKKMIDDVRLMNEDDDFDDPEKARCMWP